MLLASTLFCHEVSWFLSGKSQSKVRAPRRAQPPMHAAMAPCRSMRQPRLRLPSLCTFVTSGTAHQQQRPHDHSTPTPLMLQMEVDLRRHRDLSISVDITFHALPCAGKGAG